MIITYHKFVLDFTIQVSRAINEHKAEIVEQAKDMVVLKYPDCDELFKHVLER